MAYENNTDVKVKSTEAESAKIIVTLTLGWVGLMALMGGLGVLYMNMGDHDKGPSLEELTRNVQSQAAVKPE